MKTDEQEDAVGSFLGNGGRLYADPEEPQGPDAFNDPIRLVPAPEPTPPVRTKPVKEEVVTKEKPPKDVRGGVSTALELAGIGAVTVGGFLVAPWLGCMLLGILLLLLGVAVGYRG
jgi:hypothetical protein